MMACFPEIDSPCPLDVEAKSRLHGHCGHCRKTVHSLDGMDDARRAAFMAQATGPICVSYRLPVAVGAAALALSIASPAFAREVHKAIENARHCPVAAGRFQAQPSAAVSPTHPEQAMEPAAASPGPQTLKPILVMVGGVSDPRQARWSDDDASTPELPAVHDTRSPSP